MNGGFSPFELDPFTNGYHQQSPSNTASQQRSYHLQGMQVPAPCYERYDPTTQHSQQTPVAAAAPVLLGFEPLPYNSTAHHTVVRPASDVFSLEPDPIATAVEQRHRGWAVAPSSTADPVDALSGALIDPGMDDLFLGSLSSTPVPQKVRKITNPDAWLDTISIEVSGVSLEPMSGSEILSRVKSRVVDVERRYLPCVDFLVSCQQELRAGLAVATQRRLVRASYRDTLTPRQFYQRYLEPLPNRFYHKNHRIMEPTHLNEAFAQVKKLCGDAKKVEYQGCEYIKNSFLGGMKDGESWGLRKWLSKNGGALHICNDLECILLACQKMDRNSDNTRKLAARLRPLAKKALDRLKREVPPSYQEQSSAHPYLPFFHRLECALRGVSNFDPEDDDVICIDDDDEIEEVKSKASIPKVAKTSEPKRKSCDDDERSAKRKKAFHDTIGDSSAAFEVAPRGPLHYGNATGGNNSAGGHDSDEDSDIEVVGVVNPDKNGGPVQQQSPAATVTTPVVAKNKSKQPLRCTRCTMLNSAGSPRCCMCDQTFDRSENYQVEEENYEEDTFSDFDNIPGMEEATATIAAELWDPTGSETEDVINTPTNTTDAAHLSSEAKSPSVLGGSVLTASEMANRIEHMAFMFDIDKQHMVRPDHFRSACFWDSRVQYASVLRLFVSILRNRESHTFLESVNESALIACGKPRFCDVIRNPLCFRDIVIALQGDGTLPSQGLRNWNMWRGKDLLQAVDLVFLNSLAYYGKDRSRRRSQTNSLRKYLWDGMNNIISSVLGGDADKRQHLPTRRGERSGFVIHK